MNRIKYIKKQIAKNDVISFDIFDTLIKRDVPCPGDVFDLVYSKFSGEKLQKNSKFRRIREKSEEVARKKLLKNEIDIEDIYKYMDYDISDSNKELLINIEKEIEKSVCIRNIDIMDVYNFAIDNGKKIIITTDMYLPIETIENILLTNGFKQYENIFLSSELNATKSDGSLFELIKKEYPNERIVHIGDNIKSDVINSMIHGISGLHWKKNNSKLYHDNDINYISNFINNRIDSNDDYYYKFGYQCMGPLLFSFSKWINKSVEGDEYRNIYFLARDGMIMKRAYDLLFNEDSNISTHYLLASRKSYIVPTLHKYNTVEEALSKMFISNFITLKYLMRKMNVSDEEIDKDILNNTDINHVYKNIDDLLRDDKAKQTLDKVFQVASEKSKVDDYNLKEYLNLSDFHGNVGIVDIGWFGNMQNALIQVTDNKNIHGYYLGIKSNSMYKESQNMKGFLFNGTYKNENEIYVRTFSGVLELLFTRYDIGTFEGFKKVEDKLIPIYGNNDYSNEFSFKAIKSIQDAAIDFIMDYKKSYLYEVLDIDMDEGYKRLKDFSVSPSFKDVYMFNKIHKNKEDGLEFITKNNAFNYLMHPGNIVSDLQSSWFSAYVYKTFKLRIPVSRIYKYFKMKGYK